MQKKIISLNLISYILRYIALVIVIISTMGGFLYYFFYKTTYSDFLTMNRQHISAVARQHENDIRVIDDIVIQIGMTDDVTRFKLERQPLKAVGLKEHLKRYNTVSQFFALILYQYHDDRYMYSYASSIDIEDFLNTGCILENVSINAFGEQIFNPQNIVQILPEQEVSGRFIKEYMGGDNKAVMYLRLVPMNFDETLIFMVLESYYDQLLLNDISDERADFLYYDGCIIVSRNSNGITEEQVREIIFTEKIEEVLKKGDNIQKQIEIDNSNYLLSVIKGHSNIYYISMQPMEVFYAKFKTKQWVLLLFVLLMVMMATFMVGISSGRMMRKVKGLSLLLGKDSSYDLGYIERGIQALVITNKNSEKENLSLKKAEFIRNFFRGYLGNRESMVSEAAKVELFVDYEKYVIVLLRNKEGDVYDKIYGLFLDMISQEKDMEGYGIYLVSNKQNLFVLFGNTETKIENVLDKMVEIERQYCHDYVISVSNYHTDFAEASKAYLEADAAFDYRLLVNNNEIIRFKDVVHEELPCFSLENYLHVLKHAISTGSKTELETTVEDICQKLKDANVSLYMFRVFYNDIFQMLVSECRGDKLLIDKFYNVFTLSQCMSMKEFNDLLSEAGRMIIDNRSCKILENSDVVCKAVVYMQEMYDDPNLTMNTLAEYLNVSSVTLSIEFKNEMNITPSEYLANMRIEKSKYLLRNTKKLIKEISREVGYEDEGSFARRFKKHTGMTPGQYRDKAMRN